MLGNKNHLKIDPVTGIISGIPDSIGQYLVGICVEEYRNGILFSTIRRDFEYNVVQCIHIKSKWTTNTTSGSLNAVFKHKSLMSNLFNWSYLALFKEKERPIIFKTGGGGFMETARKII